VINAAIQISPGAQISVDYISELGESRIEEMITISIYEQVTIPSSENPKEVLVDSQLTMHVNIRQAVQLLRQLEFAVKGAEKHNMLLAENASNSHLPAQLTSKPVTLEDVSDKDS
jgi:hypothetical protein